MLLPAEPCRCWQASATPSPPALWRGAEARAQGCWRAAIAAGKGMPALCAQCLRELPLPGAHVAALLAPARVRPNPSQLPRPFRVLFICMENRTGCCSSADKASALKHNQNKKPKMQHSLFLLPQLLPALLPLLLEGNFVEKTIR